MWVNSDVFGDPCPGTHKYVEVHFACAPRILATTTKRPLPPWFLQGGADNLWNNPKKLSPTTSTTIFVSFRIKFNNLKKVLHISISFQEQEKNLTYQIDEK